MAINLELYKKNKETIKNLKKIDKFFVENYPDKTDGWIGLITLIYAEWSVKEFLNKNIIDPKYITAVRSVLWEFLNIVNSYDDSRKGKE